MKIIFQKTFFKFQAKIKILKVSLVIKVWIILILGDNLNIFNGLLDTYGWVLNYYFSMFSQD